jgi:hypothetical protein
MSLSTAIFESVNVNGFLNVLYDSSFNGNVLIKSTTNSTSSTTGALVVNGGAGFNGNVWINGNFFAKNTKVTYWDSQNLGITSFQSNTYYLLATMGDFSNNIGSINITGAIGGQIGSTISTINATIITSGNIASPTIIGSINNYSVNPPCDIVIYYDNSSNNYTQSSVKVFDISGFIYDSSNIYYNASGSLINVNQFITGPGISSNTTINYVDNNNAFLINTKQNNLSPTTINRTATGLVFDSDRFFIINDPNPLQPPGYFITATATAYTPFANYNKPFTRQRSNNSYTMQNSNTFNTDPSILTDINGFIINRSGIPYFIAGSTTYNSKILFKSGAVINIAQLSNTNTNTYSLSYGNNNTPLNSFLGYYSGTTLKSNINALVNGYLITNNNDGSVSPTFLDGTRVNAVTNYTTTLTSPGTIPSTTASSISGVVRLHAGTYYFTYPFNGTDPGLNSFITSASSPNIPDSSAIFLHTRVSGGNNYILGPAVNLNSTSISTSRFGLSGERVPYYIVDGSTIALPLRDSSRNIGIYNTISNAVGGDIVTFGNDITQGRYDGYTLTASGDYLADASNARHYIRVNNASFVADASAGSATITTSSNYARGAAIAILNNRGTIAVGQYISVPARAAYNRSSIRVTTTNGNTTMTLDFSLNMVGLAGATPVHFYNPDISLNILAPTTFLDYPSTQLYYSDTTFSLYNPVTFNFYKPNNYSLFDIIDLSDGMGPPPQYKIYLSTKQGGKGYFNLAITGDVSSNSSNNIFYPTIVPSVPISGTNQIIPSICNSLYATNNSFNTTINPISSITLANIVNTTLYSGTPAPPYELVGDDVSIIMNTNISQCYFSISDSNLLGGSSVKITIQCSTNEIGINNKLYFSIGYSSVTPLFISPYLSLASITYIANITIPTTNAGIIYFYVYANSVSSGTRNTMYISSISISYLDMYTYGQVGIGKTEPQCALDILGNSGTLLKLTNNTTDYTQGETSIEFWKNQTNYNLGKISAFDTAISPNTFKSTLVLYAAWNTSFVPGVTIVAISAGNTCVGINTSDPNQLWTLYVNGSAYFEQDVDALSYNARSDYRLKENIIPISDTDFSIDSLKPVYYTFKESKKADLGFLAHEVQADLPFLVTGEKDGKEMQSINYNGFIALLVKEIQDLKQENKILKEKNTEITEKNNLFESRLQLLESILLK